MPIAISAGPRNVVGPTGHQSPWWVGAPTPGRVSGSGHASGQFRSAEPSNTSRKRPGTVGMRKPRPGSQSDFHAALPGPNA